MPIEMTNEPLLIQQQARIKFKKQRMITRLILFVLLSALGIFLCVKLGLLGAGMFLGVLLVLLINWGNDQRKIRIMRTALGKDAGY